MKKIIVGLVTLLAGASVQLVSATYLPGAQGSGVSVGTEWFFNQQDISAPKTQQQCSEFWGQETYYLSGDADADGIPDLGKQWYFKDNFVYNSATSTRGAALILPRYSTYNGSTVSYYTPSTNMLNVYNAGSQYPLSSQKAWYRYSKVAPLNQPVRAITSEPLLMEAPASRLASDAHFQIAYDVNFAVFSSWGTSTSDYFVATVSSLTDLNAVPASSKWYMKAGLTNPDGPLRSSDFANQTTSIAARSINWSNEIAHGTECVNVNLKWCGDTVVDTAYGEACDLGAQNGQPGAQCTSTCTLPPVVQEPDVTIVKTVVGATTGYLNNDIVTYRLLYRNIGTGLANNVIIKDSLPAGVTYVSSTSNPNIGQPTQAANILTWPTIATLAPGAQGEIIVQVRITQFAACLPYTNTSSIAASNEPVIYNGNNTSSADFTTACPNPDVVTQKSVSAISGSYLPGQVVEYTLTYQNIGAAVANGVIVTDTLPSQVTYIVGSSTSTAGLPQPTVVGQTLTWNVGSLNPGQSGQIKIKVTIKANTPTCTSLIVRNDFTISATNEPSTLLFNNPSNATFPMQCVDLFSNKVVDKPVVVSGDIVTYTITYGNAGDVTWPGIVTDTLPAGTTYVVNSATSNPNIGQPTVVGQTLTWNVGNLPPGSSRTITFQAKIITATPGQIYLNTVCIADDNNYNNNNCGTATSTTTGGNGMIDLWSNKVVDKPVVVSGDIVTYTISYGNLGTVAATGIVTDTLPAGTAYIANSTTSNPNVGQPTVAGQSLTWDVGVLPPGSSRTITFKARITASTPGQIYLNTVCIADDNNYNNNNCGTATSTTTGGGGSTLYDLSIDKNPKYQIAFSGQDVTFTLTVANAGPAAANNFAVNDYLPAGLQFVSASPAATYTAATRTITRNGLSLNANGTQNLTVVAKYIGSSTEVNWTEICAYNGANSGLSPRDVDSNPCNGTGNNEDDVSSGKVESAFLDLNLNKLVNGVKAYDAFSGETVDFSLVVGNSGSVTATNFSVNDYLPAGFTFVQASAGGIYDSGTSKITWNGLTLVAGATTTLTFKAIYTDSVARINYAEVCTYNGLNGTGAGAKDIDSDPCNRGATTPVEDDESSATVRPRTASNIFDLSIDKLIGGVKVRDGAVSGQVYPVTLTVTNSGGVGVSNFSVRDYMPEGLDYVAGSANPATITYDTGTKLLIFTGLNIGANQTITLTFNALYHSTVYQTNYTEICDYRGTNASGNEAKDIDSNPCNRGPNLGIEDDESSAQIGPGGGGGGGPTMDLTLNKLVNGVKDYTANSNEVVTFTLHASNEGNTTIVNAAIVDYLPTNVEFVTGSANTPSPSVFSYDPTTRKLVWSGLTFTNNSAFDLTFKATYNATDVRTNYAEICAYNGKTTNTSGMPSSSTNPQDPDSDPCNRGATTPVEDDESSAVIRPRTGGCTNPNGCGGGSRNYCGDGLIARPNSYGQYEECDEGANNGKAGYNCSITCKTSGGGGNTCGDGVLQYGEVCDQGRAGGKIPVGRPYAGRTCSSSCSLPGVAAPACDYIDPPSIMSNEYLPYRWDLEDIDSLATSCTNAGDVIRDSLQCTFWVTDSKGNKVSNANGQFEWTGPCNDPTADRLTKSAYIQVIKSLGYNPDSAQIRPYGYNSSKFNFTYLGEHKISMRLESYKMCVSGTNGLVQQEVTYNQMSKKRVCEMNFAVTTPYMVSRGPLGNFSTDSLTSFLYMPNGLQVFPNPVPKITQKFDVTTEVKDSVNKLVNEYKKVAVVADAVPAFGNVSKVPGKDIYFFEGTRDDATVTISDASVTTLGNKPFTIILTRGHLVVKGNLAKAQNGMYINASSVGSIRFAMDDKEGVNGVKGCDVTQDVNGIFISVNTIESYNHLGNPEGVANTDINKDWCNGGDLTIRGVLIGNGIDSVVSKRRSNVNTWFTELTQINADRKEYLLNHGAVVLKYNPTLFDNLPPGAEILAQVLNTYKK